MEIADIKVYRFERLKQQPHIVHGIFTRAGGTSTGAFDSLNIGMNSGDAPLAIAENRKRIIEKMGMKPLVFLNQVHGDKIKVLKQGDSDFLKTFDPGRETYTADAVITDMRNVALVIQVADCQAVMLYDPEKKVIANIHSGWRGSVGNIVGNCLDRMMLEFGCRPEKIMVGISPSLGPCCSEFVNFQEEIPKHLWKYKIADTVYFNFWDLTADQLMEKGVKKEHIENMDLCTKCHSDIFYSYRANKTTGRFACVICLV